MEKLVTKIGDVTIERRVSKTSLQKFAADRNPSPQSGAKNALDDIVKPYLQPEIIKKENVFPEKQCSTASARVVNTAIPNIYVSNSLDLKSDVEQKIALPKRTPWDLNPQPKLESWNQFDRTELKTLTKCDSGSEKNIEPTAAEQPDMSRFGGISIERKRARLPGRETSDYNDRSFTEHNSMDGEQNKVNSVGESFKSGFQSDSALPSKATSGKDYSSPSAQKLPYSDFTFEKKSNCEGNLRHYLGNNYDNMSVSAQHFLAKTFSSKSPIHLSSDDEKPVGEDVDTDPKEIDFEERYDNDSEEYDEDDVSSPAQRLDGECVAEPGKLGEDGKRGTVPAEKQESFCRGGSPIILSSEDDDKNDEDVVEVTDRSEFRNSTNLNSQPVKQYSEPIVLDDSVSDSSGKKNELQQSCPDISKVKLPRKTNASACAELSGQPIVKKKNCDVSEIVSDKSIPLDNQNKENQQDCKDSKEMQKSILNDTIDVETDPEDAPDKREQELNSPETESEEITRDCEDSSFDEKNVKTEQEDEESVLKSSETELPASDESVEGDEKETKAGDVKPEVGDIVCDDLMELMKKGEIEGEMEDEEDKEFESEEDGSGKKSGKKRKAGEDGEVEKDESKTKSKKKKSEKSEGESGKEEDDKNIDKTKVTSANLRKNIREVMDETKLDEATLSAQRQEAERLKRLQDQQKIIRELQKQIVFNRQNQKSHNRVLSLLQGNSQTSILKTSSSAAPQTTTQSKSPNHVLVKLSNGQQTSLNNKKMIELLKNSKNKVTLTKPSIPKTFLKQGMVSPSVSIAPIVKKEFPVDDKKKKKGDVVTLSSDSEDDCIVLSEEDESEPEEDPTNSGMHTSDKYNVPDEQGRVIVNVGHPESESDIFLAPQIARIIKPHQIGGIRFLYDNVIESVERFQSSTGFGCILAHSMGLGKTLQIVSFSDIFLRYTTAKTILCIMPINTIQNWLAEFNMWLPKENNTNQEIRCRDFDLFIVNESLKNLNARSKVILDWQRSGGVLLMGYELFRLLSLKKSYKSKKKKREIEEKEDEAKNKELIEEVYAALVRPGPDLVICDEGHRIKNSHATTSQALKQIRTKRRIVLTGYPLQNNLLEYWCMVDFVRPNYLGSKTEFSNMFERPIQNGQCIDSTPQDKRLMRYRAHVLHSLLEGFVQRRSHAVLQSTLPEKEEYVLLLRFTPFQRKLYDTFMNEVVRTVAVPNPLKAFAVCCKIWNHPDVLYNFLKKKGEEIDLDLEEALPPSLQPSNYPFGQTPPDGMSQFPPSPMVQPWPRRGPGSRGGKVRQCMGNRRPGRGRKPAATVSPNLMPGCEKKEQDSEGFNTNNYPSSYPDFHLQKSNESLAEGDRGNRNFGARSFNQYQSSEFGNPSNFTGPGYEGKNPLENLEDLSTGDFQNKVFYPQQGENSIQTNFSATPCMQQQNMNYPQNMSQSNNSDVNSGFNSNMNRNDSRFSQSDTSKPFPYNQDYNPEYYPGANYPAQQPRADFEQNSKTSFNRNNPSSDSTNPYYQNSRFAEGRENNMSYSIQSANNSMDSSFQGYGNRNPDQNFQGNLNKHYQSQTLPISNSSYNESNNAGMNYQNTMMDSRRKSCPSDMQNRTTYSQPASRSGDANYQRNNFQSSGSNFTNNASDFSQANSERDMNSGSNFHGNSGNFSRPGYPQDYWAGGNWSSCGFDSNKGDGDRSSEFLQGEKYNAYDSGSDNANTKKFASDDLEKKSNFGVRVKNEVELEGNYGKFEDDRSGNKVKEEGLQSKVEEEVKLEKKEDFKCPEVSTKKDDQLPYDWATDLFKSYVTGIIENSSKMEVFFHILTESVKLGDRLLVFSQSLLTLDLVEDYLHRRNVPDREEKWAKNRNYFRLDGSTPGLEREKLINEFNSNSNIFIFLVSTRAGSLGINLVGANRVVVFDASWNPCHDTQAVCRVYRYGQQKPCYVYRLVMDSCLEKKIYDRQINKQGMADRVVDELNPDAHLSIKEVTNLCWDDQEDTTVKDLSYLKDKYNDQIIKILLENCSKLLSKEPFQHESLLIDRKEKKLSQAEKRLAKRSYELEKQAANQPKNIYSFFPNAGGPRNFGKPIASVRPMQNEMASRVPPIPNRSKWIPAEVWQKQGMSAQEMTLPLDVVIPTNAPDKTSIVLKAGQRVMVLKSPKGIYMQLENGKIIAIRTAFKVGQGSSAGSQSKTDEIKKDVPLPVSSALKNNPNVTITSKSANSKMLSTKPPFIRAPDKKLPINMAAARPKQILGKAKPFLLNRKFQSVTPEIRQRILVGKTSFETQDEKSASKGVEDNDVILAKDMKESSKYENSASEQDVDPLDQKRKDEQQTVQEQSGHKGEMNSSLETLRKVTENIKDDTKLENSSDNPQVQMNLKNYRHNFSSQLKSKSQDSDEEKEVKKVNEADSGSLKPVEEPPGSFNGNENVQNWLMNQSYSNVDSYNNYFSNYYGYGHNAGPMMDPYEGFYPNNYSHSLSRTGSAPPKQDSQVDGAKTVTPYQQNQPLTSPKIQSTPNPSTPRSSSSSMYSYPNPYHHQYSYNYPSGPGYNNQSYPFTGQNQGNQQQQSSMNSANPSSSNSSQNQPYDNSMYSAFHRPEGHYQSSENAYPTSYRPPYPNSTTPGFFPYNTPYRPYPDSNYHYSPNFNPYMPHAGYSYPMQNPSQLNNNSSFNQHSTESATNSS